MKVMIHKLKKPMPPKTLNEFLTENGLELHVHERNLKCAVPGTLQYYADTKPSISIQDDQWLNPGMGNGSSIFAAIDAFINIISHKRILIGNTAIKVPQILPFKVDSVEYEEDYTE